MCGYWDIRSVKEMQPWRVLLSKQGSSPRQPRSHSHQLVSVIRCILDRLVLYPVSLDGSIRLHNQELLGAIVAKHTCIPTRHWVAAERRCRKAGRMEATRSCCRRLKSTPELWIMHKRCCTGLCGWHYTQHRILHQVLASCWTSYKL